MSTLTIIQVRMNSSRLPGKALLRLYGLPIIQHVMHATMNQDWKVCLLVPQGDANDAMLSELPLHQRYPTGEKVWSVYRFNPGEYNDVLTGVYDAACQFGPDNVIRLTGDCPMLSPDIIKNVISLHEQEGNDFTFNSDSAQGDGIDVEVMKMRVLRDCHLKASSKYDREHVTPWIRLNNDYKKGRSVVPTYPTRSINTLDDWVWVHQHWKKE